jgi:hypothetical protein
VHFYLNRKGKEGEFAVDEKMMLSYNRASLKMIRNNLHVYAMEASDPIAQNTYHESMMKIDDLLANIDLKLKEI